MKFYFVLITAIFTAHSIFAQQKESKAASILCPPAAYPEQSRVKEEEGTIHLLIKVNKDSTAGNIAIEKSSGHPRLDSAAVELIHKCQIAAGVRESAPYDSIARLKVTFRLEGGNPKSNNTLSDTDHLKMENFRRSDLTECKPGPIAGFHNCNSATLLGNGDRYDGEWKEGKREGKGSLTLSNGAKYVGEFSNGKYDGFGTLYSSSGSIISQGLWSKDVFIRSTNKQQVSLNNREVEELRIEAENAKRKQAQLEEQLLIAQQQTQTQTNNSPAVAQSIGRRIALVVGNANYKVRPLKNPRNDADDISRSLRSSGFEVIDLRDASLQQMRTGVRQFGDRLINNDVGLVYYSGHGVEVKGRNYFIPVNADIQREDEIADQGLDVSLILEKMNTAGKGVNILIVDACRDDPFGRSFRSSSRGLAQMDAPRGTIIAYATSPGKVASDGDPRERNSPYTKNLVKAMQQPNKPIEQVFKEVRRAVQEETKNQQTPWENTSLSGDFYFRFKLEDGVVKSNSTLSEAERIRKENLTNITGMASASNDFESSSISKAYPNRIVMRIKPNIRFTDDIEGNPEAIVEVKCAEDGKIIGVRLINSSGIKKWDEAVTRAVVNTGTLPLDLNGKAPPLLMISFRPKN